MIKKIVFLIALMLLPVLAGAQKVIQMEKEGGVYKIACKVNGARMKMIFDTGASSVSLSMSIANYLYDNDYITKEDILGKGKSQTADGSIVDHIVINLRDIEIDGLHLKNVEATVIAGQDAPLLLGQTAIQKLGAVTISGNRLIINNASTNKSSLSNEEVEQLKEKAETLSDNGSYNAAIELYEILRDNLRLNTYDYSKFMYLYTKTGHYEKVIELLSEWENSPVYNEEKYFYKDFIYYVARIAYSKNEDYNSLIKYTEKEIAVKQLSEAELGIKEFSYTDYVSYAQDYEKVEKYDIAKKYYLKGLKELLLLYDVSIADIYNGRINNGDLKKELGEILTLYSYLHAKTRITDSCKYLFAGAAKCGEELAIEWCDRENVDYKNIKYNREYDYLFADR